LRHEAIFAGAAGSVPDQFDEFFIHESVLAIHFRAACLSAWRAFECRIPRRQPALA
jgi:hypothetical protein